MSLRRTILVITVMFAVLTFGSIPAAAHPTRELLATFGHFEHPAGIAVDLETGNVYVTELKTDTVDIYSATGGAPVDGVPAQITGLDLGTGVAVDNSCYEHEPRLEGEACEKFDPSYGDIYVVNHAMPESIERLKLNDGEYEKVGAIVIKGALDPLGVTVDSRGDVYVACYFSQIKEWKVSGEEVVIEQKGQNIVIQAGYVALDSLGNLYASSNYDNGSPGQVGVVKLALGSAGEVLSEMVFAPPLEGEYRPMAVNRATNNVFISERDHITEYNAADEVQLEFGSSESRGGSLVGQGPVTAVAANSATGGVYVANVSDDDVDVFGPLLGPPVVPAAQPAASDLTRTSALLAGTANPEGGRASYYYQYVPAEEYEAGAADPYVQGGRTASEALPSAHADEAIERVALTGLRPGTTYHYRLVVSNPSETAYGPDQAFTTASATPPAVSTGLASEVSATGVTLAGTVDPRGLATSYVFEVGTDTTYNGAKLFGNAGSGTGEEHVSVSLQFLVPGVTYHYRLVATSFDGTSYGQDETFTTPGVPTPIAQPAATPLIASPSVQFPSVAGAVTTPVATKKSKQTQTRGEKLAVALRGCRKESPGKRRKACEARVRKTHGQTGTINDSRKR
jgi:hypothetical protein